MFTYVSQHVIELMRQINSSSLCCASCYVLFCRKSGGKSATCCPSSPPPPPPPPQTNGPTLLTHITNIEPTRLSGHPWVTAEVVGDDDSVFSLPPLLLHSSCVCFSVVFTRSLPAKHNQRRRESSDRLRDIPVATATSRNMISGCRSGISK